MKIEHDTSMLECETIGCFLETHMTMFGLQKTQICCESLVVGITNPIKVTIIYKNVDEDGQN